MPVSPDLFDRAFAVWQAFGPERGRPVRERWAEALPDLDADDYAGVEARVLAAERTAYDIAASASVLGDPGARQRLREALPDLTDERLSRTWNQACYFATK